MTLLSQSQYPAHRPFFPQRKPSPVESKSETLLHRPFNVANNQKLIMGNSHPQQPSFVLSANSIEDWVKVQEQGYCQLWMHKQTNKQVQAYPIPESFVRNQDQLQKYHFRKAHRQHLVVVEAILTPGNSSFCSQPRTAYALVQNITGRLSQFKRCLTFQQALYVLSAAASGYNTLNSFFGPLEPHAEMVCFNDAGEVKIWLNENLALNEPSPTTRSQNLPSDDYNIAQRRTKEGVNKLIKIVQQASAQEFGHPFSEECKKLSTYFETANMVSYFCYANNIELPSRVLVCKNLQNPTVFDRAILRQESSHSLQGKVASLDSSRVKTVLFKSSQVHERDQLINPQVPPRHPESIHFNPEPRPSQKTNHSPKITFNIRSTLPAQLNQEKVEGVLFGRPIFKTPILHPTPTPNPSPNPNPNRNPQFTKPPINSFAHPEPKIQIRLEEVKRTKNAPQNVTVFTNPVVTQLPEKQVKSQIIQNTVEEPLQSRKPSENEASHNQTFINKVINVNDQKIPIIATFPQQTSSQTQENKQIEREIVQTLSEPSSEQQIAQQPNSQEVIPREPQPQIYEQYEPQENNIKETGYFYFHSEDPTHLSKHNDHANPFHRDHPFHAFQQPQAHEPPHSKAEAIEELRKLVYEQEVEKAQASHYRSDSRHSHSKQEYHSEDEEKYQLDYLSRQEEALNKEELQQSAHSQIERYVPPTNHHRYPQSPIIEQLEENFSSPPKDNTEIEQWEARLTKFTQSRHSHHDPEPKTFETERLPELLHAPSTDSRNPDPAPLPEQPGNELAHLDECGIEEYIRKKYNLYSQPSSAHEVDYPSSKRLPPKQRAARHDFERPAPSEDYLFKAASYKPKLDTYHESWRSKDTPKDVYEKENYYPSYLDYQPNHNRVSIELSQPESYSSRYLFQEDSEDKHANKEAEKPKYKPTEMSKIEERYNKYVVNANRTRQSANKSLLSKDVSLILAADESKITRFSPKPAFSDLEQSVKRANILPQGYNPSPKYKTEVTYEKLRNLLWEE